MKNTILMLVAVAMLVSCSGGNKSSSGPLGKNVVASINGNAISLEEFNKRYEWYVKRYKFRIPKQQFLKNLIDLELSSQEALKQKLNKEEKLKYDYKILLSQHLLEKEVYQQFEKINLSDAELKAQFEKSPEIRASHILFKVSEKNTPKEVDIIKVKAEKILKLVKKKGANFAKLAKKHSEGPSAKNGGDLDYFTKETMVPEFSSAAFSLAKIGDVSGLVKTKYGFHIIKLTGRKEFEKADKRRLKSRAQSLMQKDIYDKFFNGLKKNASIQTNEMLIQN